MLDVVAPDAVDAVDRKPIVAGAASDLLDAETAAAMREAAPHAVIAEVPGVGHAPMLDEPEALAAIKAHLDAAP